MPEATRREGVHRLSLPVRVRKEQDNLVRQGYVRPRLRGLERSKGRKSEELGGSWPRRE